MTTTAAQLDAKTSALSRYGIGFAVLIVLTCLGIMVGLWGNYVWDGRFMDTDNYTRLAKLQEFWLHGGWFDPVQHRISPPPGHSSHWSKPLDIILLVGALPLSPILGFNKALFWWAAIVPPITFAGMAFFAPWMSQPFLGMRRDWLATALLATQWAILGGMAFGRPDHNDVMLPCFMVLAGYTGRILLLGADRRQAIILGIVAAIGVWTSLEFMITVAMSLAVFGFGWLVRRPRMAEMGFVMSASSTIGLAIAIGLEKGPDRLIEFTLDQISWPYLMAFVGVTAAWVVLLIIERRDLLLHPVQRMIAAGIAVGVFGAGVLAVSPELLAGPLSMVDPLYHATRLVIIDEYMPVINTERYGWLVNSGRAIYALLFPIVTVLLALYFALKGDRNERWAQIYVLITASTYLVLNIDAMHWGVYTGLIAVPMFVRLGRVCLEKIEDFPIPVVGMLMRVGLMVLLLFGSPMVGNTLMALGNIGDRGLIYRICDYSSVIGTLNDPNGIGASPKRLVAFVDFNPELLYRTHHYVYSVPNHRPQPGYTETYELMSESNMDAVPKQLEEMQAEYLLICTDKSEGNFYKTISKDRNFHDRLADGESFPYLQPVPLPENAKQLRLYKIVLPNK